MKANLTAIKLQLDLSALRKVIRFIYFAPKGLTARVVELVVFK